MAEIVATPQEIAQSITTMHDVVVAAWLREEMPYSPLAEARTTTQWGMDIGRGCYLTVVEDYLHEYRSLEAPFDYDRSNGIKVPLRVNVPGGRRGMFKLSTNFLEDCYPNDSETLSSTGLLRLLDVSAPQEVFEYLQDATTSGKAVKNSVHRMVVSALPTGNHWPSLHVQDTTRDDGSTLIQADFTQLFETDLGVKHLTFEGWVLDDDEGTALLHHEYSDTRKTPEITTLTPERLEQLGQFTLRTLDIVHGHGSHRHDIWKNTTRKEVTGVDGQPSENARYGYDFSRDTMAGIPR